MNEIVPIYESEIQTRQSATKKETAKTYMERCYVTNLTSVRFYF